MAKSTQQRRQQDPVPNPVHQQRKTVTERELRGRLGPDARPRPAGGPCKQDVTGGIRAATRPGWWHGGELGQEKLRGPILKLGVGLGR